MLSHEIGPGNAGNGVTESPISRIFRGTCPQTPLEIRAFGTTVRTYGAHVCLFHLRIWYFKMIPKPLNSSLSRAKTSFRCVGWCCSPIYYWLFRTPVISSNSWFPLRVRYSWSPLHIFCCKSVSLFCNIHVIRSQQICLAKGRRPCQMLRLGTAPPILAPLLLTSVTLVTHYLVHQQEHAERMENGMESGRTAVSCCLN